MAKHPWRFQCDIPYGETDPTVTVFVGEVFTRGDGSVFVEQTINDPVTMKLSEVSNVLSLIDNSVVVKQDEIIEQRKTDLAKAQATVAEKP